MKYVGITIGPIFKTIKLAISPVGLWYASTFFSEVTKQFCSQLTEEYQEVEIFSPYFDKASSQPYDGIGKFHDRVLFSVPNLNNECLDKLIDSVKGAMADYFCYGEETEKREFLTKYLRIDYVIFDEKDLEGKSLVKELNWALDALEIMPPIHPIPSINLFSKIFIGSLDEQGKSNRNSYIRQSKLHQNIKSGHNFLKQKDGNFKSIESIAQGLNTESESMPYFAVVSSDGDKIGEFLKIICTDDKGIFLSLEEQKANIKRFSKKCQLYAEKAAGHINEKGGMVIYAGGDDLLFLAPVPIVFELCLYLPNCFKKIFSDENIEKSKSDISFGVAIRYQKFPLYETLETVSQKMYEAKKEGGARIALSLSKHSGQTIELVLTQKQMLDILELLKQEKDLSKEDLSSIIYSLESKKRLFALLLKEAVEKDYSFEEFKIRFKNNFSNISQASFDDYINRIAEYFHQEFVKPKREQLSLENYEDDILRLSKILRLLKFLKGGE